MPVLLTAFLSLAACALVLATGVKSTERFTIHIGSRLPPAELGCVRSGHVQTDEGRRLSVFKCPIRSAVSRLGQLVEVQGEKRHAKAAERDEQVLGGEDCNSRYKTLLTNVTEVQ